MVNENVVTLNWKYLGKINDNDFQIKAKQILQTELINKREVVSPVSGIYVWIMPEINKNKKIVVYVGESTTIWKRLEQEIIDLLGGAWSSFDLSKLNYDYRGFLRRVFLKDDGTVAERQYGISKEKDYYIPNRGQIDCMSALVDKDRIKWAQDMLDKMEFAIAIVNDDFGDKKRFKEKLRDIEATIIMGLIKQADYLSDTSKSIKSAFFGNASQNPKGIITIKHEGDRDKMPEEIIYPK